MSDWRTQVLPDGRRVEFLDAVLIETSDEGLKVMVHMAVDGVFVNQEVVLTPEDIAKERNDD